MNLEVKLAAHMRMLGYDISATDTQSIVNKLIQYLELIKKWNRVHNLTSIRMPEDMLSYHIMDSLAVLPQLHGERRCWQRRWFARGPDCCCPARLAGCFN